MEKSKALPCFCSIWTALALIAAFFLFIECSGDDYQVKQCEEGQGLDLDNTGIPIYGGEESPIDVTLFVDFQCPFSGNMALHVFALMDKLMIKGLADRMKIHIRHFPSPDHNRAMAAAIAAEAAHRQGNDAFFRLFFHLFQQGVDLTDEKILTYAELAKLDMDLFKEDLDNPKTVEVVNRDFDLALEIGFEGTPGVVICGVVTDGDPDSVVDNLEYLVEDQS